ncbi:hypothetical protein F989_02369, partial [Acinetobacter parvus NIPH 1103]
ALGNDSETDRDNSISVGKAGAEKQITNVKAGTQGTDAVNKQQLDTAIAGVSGGTVATDNYAHYAGDTALGSASGTAHTTTRTNGRITTVAGITVTATGENIDDITSFTVNGVTTTKAADPDKVAAFINAAKNGGNIAVGLYSSAVGVKNVASNYGSSAVGRQNKASGFESSAFGSHNEASGYASSAVGYSNEASGVNSSAVGFGNEASGVNSSAVGFENTASGIVSNAFGVKTIADKKGSIAVGGWYDKDEDSLINTILTETETAAATGVSSVAIGAGVTATADRSSVFGVGSQATALNATAIGFNSLADEANTISVGKAGAEKRITNVADATKATDAVNKQQLDTAIAGVSGGTVASDNYARTAT